MLILLIFFFPLEVGKAVDENLSVFVFRLGYGHSYKTLRVDP